MRYANGLMHLFSRFYRGVQRWLVSTIRLKWVAIRLPEYVK
jgi:hypothetical protein